MAFGIAAKMNAARAIIDVRDPQHFVGRGVRADEASRKKVSRGIMAGKKSRGFGALNLHCMMARPISVRVHRIFRRFGRTDARGIFLPSARYSELD